MCFNVFSHNRDDHSRNFSYLYDEEENRWRLSPAYDLTYSNSIGGEHATCVNGNGLNPGREDLMAVRHRPGSKPGRPGISLGRWRKRFGIPCTSGEGHLPGQPSVVPDALASYDLDGEEHRGTQGGTGARSIYGQLI